MISPGIRGNIPVSHFSPESVNFLKDLRRHNNKQWFEENRRTYEVYLLAPLRQLVNQLAPILRSAGLPLELLEVCNYRSFYCIRRQPIGEALWQEGAESFQYLGPIYRYVVGI